MSFFCLESCPDIWLYLCLQWEYYLWPPWAGLFLQRESYITEFTFIYFEASFVELLFHRVETLLESGGGNYRV